MDLTQLLPEDVIADVLHRVSPRSLAASRCACKALQDIIDARGLLRADLLPLSVSGIFINFHDVPLPEFFSRPSTGPTISGRFDYLPSSSGYPSARGPFLIQDHCNGLLLLEHYVVNPATRQWHSLPPRPSIANHIDEDFNYEEYLVYDPAISPHYEVFRILRLRYYYKVKRGDFFNNWTEDASESESMTEDSEWPPYVFALNVFSSRSGHWEERTFIREGKVVGTMSTMRVPMEWGRKRYAVYWREALYVHCEADFLMRLCLSNGTYTLIKPPIKTEGIDHPLHLGRSENGVYFATIREACLLQVWILEEPSGQMNWVLKHNSCLTSTMQRRDYDRPVLGPWVLQDINFNITAYTEPNERDEGLEFLMQKKFELNSSREETVEEKYEWDSDNDNIIEKEDMVDELYGSAGLLGFHPFKEIVFLDISMRRGLAYHLKDSKVQDLGYLYPTSYYEVLPNDQFVNEAFPYTACWLGLENAEKNEKQAVYENDSFTT